MFKIESVYRSSSEFVTVKITMDVKNWNSARASGLGSLYGIDVSNAVYREYGVKAYNPIVSDRLKAKGGIKLIELSYYDTDWNEVNNVVYIDFVNKKRAA